MSVTVSSLSAGPLFWSEGEPVAQGANPPLDQYDLLLYRTLVLGYGDELIHTLNEVEILLPGIERNAEATKKALAIRLSVERDTEAGKVVRILDAFDLHKIH